MMRRTSARQLNDGLTECTRHSKPRFEGPAAPFPGSGPRIRSSRHPEVLRRRYLDGHGGCKFSGNQNFTDEATAALAQATTGGKVSRVVTAVSSQMI